MLDLFAGEVLTAYASKLTMRDKHMVKSLEKGKSFKFPAIWQATAGYHTPGTEITGDQIPHTEVTILPDDKLVSSVFVADIDEVLNHFDVRSPYATELANVLAKIYDKNVMRRIVQAARGGPLFTGDTGGGKLTLATYATDATALFNGLSDAKQAMEEKDVPLDTMPLYALLKPAQWYMLARSDKNLNKDFNGGTASIRKMELQTVDEITILKSNITPFGTNDTANSAIPTKYRADFTNTVSVLWTPMAAATAEVQGLSTQVVDQPEKQGTLIIARQMAGTDPLRTKCAMELAKA
ncbi:major capsid protein [Caulobacter phage S2B]|uniref:Major capsid protein n=2 Tax=root TaxID=1 RepID=A0AAE7ML91_9CAUD|nr:major capsid protein [Caulobacter phage S2B]